MRYGYWLPVFGGWLRNVPDEGMGTSWDYVKKLAQRSEQIGSDITLIAELFMNDIKGIDANSLEAWSTAAALAAVTERLELMVAVRPTFHEPAIFANYLSGALRNPSAAPGQFTNLLIGFALCEATGLFGLLIALMILFA